MSVSNTARLLFYWPEAVKPYCERYQRYAYNKVPEIRSFTEFFLFHELKGKLNNREIYLLGHLTGAVFFSYDAKE